MDSVCKFNVCETCVVVWVKGLVSIFMQKDGEDIFLMGLLKFFKLIVNKSLES